MRSRSSASSAHEADASSEVIQEIPIRRQVEDRGRHGRIKLLIGNIGRIKRWRRGEDHRRFMGMPQAPTMMHLGEAHMTGARRFIGLMPTRAAFSRRAEGEQGADRKN